MTILQNKHILPAILLAFTLAFAGCSDFLEEVDQDKLIPETTEHYASLLLFEFNNEYPLFQNIDHMTDNVTEVALSTAREGDKTTYTWQREIEIDEDGDNVDCNYSWENMYEDIAIANYVIELIDEATGTQEEIDFIKGEALFVRALSYFNLVNLYGDVYREESAGVKLGVPIRTNIGIEKTYSRNTLEECYQQINSDINQARSYLKSSGVTKSIYHPTVEACDLLLSRILLYQQRWDDAIVAATAVIDERYLGYLSSSVPFVTTDNNEILFSYYHVNLPWSVFNFSLSGSVSGFNDQSYQVSEDLYKLYDDNDNRKEAFFSTNTYADGTLYYTKKYSSLFSSIGKTNLRVAEAYLNRAEAYAHIGQHALAMEDIKTLHRFRYSVTSALSYDIPDNEVLSFVLTERRKELCFEDHHRWFDLKRMDNRPEITHVYTLLDSEGSRLGTETFVLFSDDPNYLLPIPLAERDNNPLIRNNNRIAKLPETNNDIIIK